MRAASFPREPNLSKSTPWLTSILMLTDSFMGISSTGLAAIVKTKGNSHVHLILRGASWGPNYSAEHVSKSRAALEKARPDIKPSVMIDCSHGMSPINSARRRSGVCGYTGNSQKNHKNQPKVLADVCEQLRKGDMSITGVMVESFLNEGRQDIPASGPKDLKHGVSM